MEDDENVNSENMLVWPRLILLHDYNFCYVASKAYLKHC